MKIALCSNYQWPHLGGIEVICEQLKRSWERSGHTITWITTDVPKAGAASTSTNVRLPAWNVLETWLQVNCPVVNPFRFGSIVRLLRSHDAVHVHSLAPGVTTLVLLAALFTRTRLVVSQQVGLIPLRSPALNAFQERFIAAMARLAERGGACLTFPTQGIADYFIKRTKMSSAVIAIAPNAYDKQVFSHVDEAERQASIASLQLPPARLRALFVGRFVDKKGIHFIEELARLMPQVAFTLVGEGVTRPEDWRMPNVRTVSLQPAAALRAYFASHDVLLLPSVGEGWPLVICEAMACSMPCLISRETFANFGQDEEMFIVCDLKIEKLRAALEGCLTGENQLLQRRRELSIYAEKTWDWSRTANQFLELFQTR